MSIALPWPAFKAYVAEVGPGRHEGPRSGSRWRRSRTVRPASMRSALHRSRHFALDSLGRLAGEAPPLAGGEYVDAARLGTWWAELEAFFREEVRRDQGSVESYLRAKNPVWNLVGRVYLHLAENKHDREHPFAFLATYTTRLSGQGRPQHQPLGQALATLSGDRPALLSLLAPVDRGAQQSPMLKDLVDTGDIF